MNTPENVMADSTLYLRVYFGGILFVFLYNIGSGILRAVGDSKRPLYFLIICCFLNIFLDLLLVVVFHMGSGRRGLRNPDLPGGQRSADHRDPVPF